MKQFRLVCSALLIVSCAEKPPQTAVAPPPVLSSTAAPAAKDLPRPLTPHPRAPDFSKMSTSPLTPSPGNSSDALWTALLFGAMAGVAALASDPKSEELKGSCLYGDPQQPAIAGPCIHVTVSLLDDDQNVLSTIDTNENGDFRFYIPPGRLYHVRVEDRKGRRSWFDKKVGQGTLISIYLRP